MLQVLFPVGLMKFRSIFRKEPFVSAFIISGSNLLPAFNAYSKKECLKDTVQQNGS